MEMDKETLLTSYLRENGLALFAKSAIALLNIWEIMMVRTSIFMAFGHQVLRVIPAALFRIVDQVSSPYLISTAKV